MAVAVICVSLLTARTLEQNKVWRTAETLFSHIVRHNDRSSRSHANLGNYYFEHHDYARALAAYHRSIEIFDGDAVVRHNMAIAYLTMPGGSEDMAIVCDRRAIEINPSYAYPYLLLHDIYAQRGETALAEEMERKGVSLLRGGR
jgi:tetratricopeptide (TPR) repeat protein